MGQKHPVGRQLSFNIRLEPNSAADVGYSILNLLFFYSFSSKWIHSNLVVKNGCFEPASISLKSLLFILQLQAVSNSSRYDHVKIALLSRPCF